MSDVLIELPRYRCHKEVWALKIAKVDHANETRPSGETVLHFENEKYAPIEVPHNWAAKHQPEVGGYFVVYEDGYRSYSPAKAFEDGYTLVRE